MERIAIIDGNSLINRAYYAMRNPMITKDGIFTQGIFGFLNMMEKIKKDYEPAYMVIAFDLKAPTFRHKAYEGYKAGRKKMPPELAMEVEKAFSIALDSRIVENVKTVEDMAEYVQECLEKKRQKLALALYEAKARMDAAMLMTARCGGADE